MDKQEKKPDVAAPVESKKTKISLKAGSKNQIVINPPEKPPVKNVNELFATARHKHAVVLEKKTEMVLQVKARQADLPEEALRQVFIRGFKNLPMNSQLTREQYAMNRVNSFIAGGAAMVEDCDLLPIQERIVHIGRKGTGGGSRPHIKREKSPYNGKPVFHVVDSNGVIKHSTGDEGEAKKHLAQKYNSYLGEAKKLKGKDPCWDNYKMVGLKANGDPNCVGPVKEDAEPIAEISKELANRYYWSAKSSGDQMDKKISAKSKKLSDKWSPRTHKNLTTLLAKSQKRSTGRLRALDRLTKEEVVVEISATKLKNYVRASAGDAIHRQNVANRTGVQDPKIVKRNAGQEVAQRKLKVEATSVAIRMQRALDKIKADRERRERLAAPYVQSVFGKKDENKPEPKKD